MLRRPFGEVPSELERVLLSAPQWLVPSGARSSS